MKLPFIVIVDDDTQVLRAIQRDIRNKYREEYRVAATIDRLWNPNVAAWYENGRNDPKLALLRLDAERAEIWESGSSVMAGIKSLFGVDPKKDFKDNVAEVSLR